MLPDGCGAVGEHLRDRRCPMRERSCSSRWSRAAIRPRCSSRRSPDSTRSGPHSPPTAWGWPHLAVAGGPHRGHQQLGPHPAQYDVSVHPARCRHSSPRSARWCVTVPRVAAVGVRTRRRRQPPPQRHRACADDETVDAMVPERVAAHGSISAEHGIGPLSVSGSGSPARPRRSGRSGPSRRRSIPAGAQPGVLYPEPSIPDAPTHWPRA